MIIRPFKELEDFARQEYARKIASLPKPKVVNVQALIAFGQDRVAEIGGVGLRAPPLSYPRGVRLLVAANAIRDLREQSAPEHFQQLASLTAVRLIRAIVRPVRRWHRVVGYRFPLQKPLEIEGMLRWLLNVPDDGAFTLSDKPGTLDWMDELLGFAHAFPALIGPDGLPLSWAHYVYGCHHLGRARARGDLRNAIAVRAAGADEKGWKSFEGEMKPAAGW